MIAQDIAEPSQIAAIRRQALLLGTQAGLDEEALDRAALIVTEAGTNLIRHARDGKILVLCTGSGRACRMEVVAVDSGPGIASVEKAMQDGFSTVRGARAGIGTGLGAIKRQSDRLDIYSDAEGTVLTASVAARPAGEMPERRLAGVIVPKPGFAVGGDAWAHRVVDEEDMVMLIDVLGHGPSADTEAQKATEAFRRTKSRSLEDVEAAVSEALAARRGAAVLLVSAGAPGQPLRAIGLGNVRGEIVAGGDRRGIPSAAGIAGTASRRPLPTEHAWPAGATLILSTDGLKTTQRTPEPAALLHRDALTIAAAIYQRRRRDTDDAGVVVMKARP